MAEYLETTQEVMSALRSSQHLCHVPVCAAVWTKPHYTTWGFKHSEDAFAREYHTKNFEPNGVSGAIGRIAAKFGVTCGKCGDVHFERYIPSYPVRYNFERVVGGFPKYCRGCYRRYFPVKDRREEMYNLWNILNGCIDLVDKRRRRKGVHNQSDWQKLWDRLGDQV